MKELNHHLQLQMWPTLGGSSSPLTANNVTVIWKHSFLRGNHSRCSSGQFYIWLVRGCSWGFKGVILYSDLINSSAALTYSPLACGEEPGGFPREARQAWANIHTPSKPAHTPTRCRNQGQNLRINQYCSKRFVHTHAHHTHRISHREALIKS